LDVGVDSTIVGFTKFLGIKGGPPDGILGGPPVVVVDIVDVVVVVVVFRTLGVDVGFGTGGSPLGTGGGTPPPVVFLISTIFSFLTSFF